MSRESFFLIDDDQVQWSRGRRVVTLLVVLIGMFLYATVGVDEARADALPAMLMSITAWVTVLGVGMFRDLNGQIRVGDPLVMMLAIYFYYFINPGITWLHGANLALSGPATVIISSELVSQIQTLHVIFMLIASGAYFAVVRPFRVQRMSAEEAEAWLPAPRTVLLIAFVPLLLVIVQRIVSDGTILPTRNYGAEWQSGQESMNEARRVGGGDQVALQLFSKIYFVPAILQGLGLGVWLCRSIARRSRWGLALFAVTMPVVMLLAGGARSGVALPFLMAVLIADHLVGPLRWRWILAGALVGLTFFNAFAVYRGVQDQGFSRAVESTREQLATEREASQASTEDSVMLVKEALMVTLVDRGAPTHGGIYFVENVLSLLPQQMYPDKLLWVPTGAQLTRLLIGRTAADEGTSGVAGSIVADGYQIERELGLMILALVMGAIYGLAARAVGIGAGHPRRAQLVQLCIFLTYVPQAYNYVRSDLGQVLVQLLYHLLIPLVGAKMLRGVVSGEAWYRPVEVRHR